MEQNFYIRVKDSNNNWNIWQVVDEFEVDGQLKYEIHSRTTCAFLEKEFCFCECGSILLCYKNGDRAIDINKSNIEFETNRQHQEFKRELNKNINPFKIFDKVDFGYLEDMEEGDWYL
jgi:hypothetical protein